LLLRKLGLFFVFAMVWAAGCGQQPAGRNFSPALTPQTSRAFGTSSVADTPQGAPGSMLLGNGKITHVVIIVQENRSFDDMFHHFPGADTADYGKTSTGGTVKLVPELLTKPMDISHSHESFSVEYRHGRMDGFNLAQSRCNQDQDKGSCRPSDTHAYGYVPRWEVKPYWAMALQYVLADRMFQTNEGPSFPAHQYLVSGTSTISNRSSLRAAENPNFSTGGGQGGCDSRRGTTVRLIDRDGEESRKMFPCFTRLSLMDRIATAGLTWRYYQAHLGHGLWNAPDAIRNIRYGPLYATDVVAPQTKVLSDIAAGNLANVVWVDPDKASSDHAGVTNGTGPSWVASVVNAVGESQYWDNTAIFITWDDWGGWYEHVKPPKYNSYELGFRVPLIVISPYARVSYVSHQQHEFGSILQFTEKALGLGSLGTTDVRSDDLSDCFDFSQKPRAFQKIPALFSASYFLNQPMSDEDPDDDF
jgi:phospholipase C